MSKKEFYRSLTKEQKDYVDFLLDNAYCQGLEAGKTEEYARQYYERY
jgi:hypothetical protein